MRPSKLVNKCVSVVLGIVEATFRKQINLSHGHHGHQSGLSWLVMVLSCWWMTPLLYHGLLCHLPLNATVMLPPPHKRMFLCVYTGRHYSGSNDDKGRNYFLSKMNISFSQKNSLKSVKTEVFGSAALYPEDPDRESRLKTGQQLFFNLTESVRQNSAKESEKWREESLAVKLQRMAQIEVLPHRHPACCLKHISQAWKDSPCSPQDHWRWTSSGAEDEKQVNQREKNGQKLQNLCTKPSPKLSAYMQPHRLED